APPAQTAPPASPKRPTVPLTSSGAREGATVVLAKLTERSLAFVADEDDQSIRTIDLAASQEIATTRLEGKPAQMIVSKSGRLFAARRDKATAAVYGATDDAATPPERTARITPATEPLALALSGDDASLVVASGWAHAIESFKTDSLERAYAVDVGREPRSVL